MNPSIEQLLRVQEVDSQIIFLKESLRQRPLELEDDRKKVQAARASLDAVLAEVKKVKVAADQREMDVKKCDAEIGKLTVALNQAKSNQEYTIYKEGIKRQEEIRDKAAEEVLEKLTVLDGMELRRKELAGVLEIAEKAFKKKEAEVQELSKALQGQIDELEGRRGGLIEGIDLEKLKIYERILQRHNNFAVARIEGQTCQGCYMSVTSQQINLLMQGQFLQCTACSRILCL
jgi:hypothetical protein